MCRGPLAYGQATAVRMCRYSRASATLTRSCLKPRDDACSLVIGQPISRRLAATTASKTTRFGTPRLRATAAIAVLAGTRRPASRARRPRAASVGRVRLGAAGGRRPATTRVISPRTSSAAQAASSASEPAAHLLVGLGQLAADRRRPVRRRTPSARSASVAASRCGASKNTMVRRSAASAASSRRRSPALRGRKPSKQNRSTGSPDTASAVVTADGPGSAVTGRPAADGGGHQPVAGVGHRRHAGVGDHQDVLRRRAARRAARAPGRARCRRRRTRPARRSDAEVGAQPAQPAGVLGGDDSRRGERVSQRAQRRARYRAAFRQDRPVRPRRFRSATTSSVAPPASRSPVARIDSASRILARCGPRHRGLTGVDPTIGVVTATAEASVKPADLVADDSARSAEAAAGRPPVPAAVGRLARSAPRVGWIITAAVTAIAALTRLWALGLPKGKKFDEVYYATEAQEMLRYGYEDNRGYMFIVHPPLGKWLIAGTSAIFGNNEVGWRLAPALAGTSACCCWSASPAGCSGPTCSAGIAGRARWPSTASRSCSPASRCSTSSCSCSCWPASGRWFSTGTRCARGSAGLLAEGVDLSDGIPTLGPRPWRLAGGVLLGLACAVKWSALVVLRACSRVLSLMWDRGALKSAGVTRSWRWAARRSWLPAVGSLVVAPTAAYLFTWLGWFAGENSWNRHWADSHPSATRLDILGLRIPFNWGFLPAGHTVARRLSPQCLPVPRGARFAARVRVQALELADPRATGQLLLSGDGVRGCGATDCSRAVLDIGTPVLWWAFIPALVWLVWRWLTSRDWRAAAILVAFVAGWVGLVAGPEAHDVPVLHDPARAVPGPRGHHGARGHPRAGHPTGR